MLSKYFFKAIITLISRTAFAKSYKKGLITKEATGRGAGDQRVKLGDRNWKIMCIVNLYWMALINWRLQCLLSD